MEKKKTERKNKLENGDDQLIAKPTSAAMEIVKEYRTIGIDTDPLGMWTGNPDDLGEVPVQDADDL